MARVRDESGPRVLNSIFFGGGTPSLMSPDTAAAIISTARSLWTPANDTEIALEANPTSVEAGRFRAYAEGGVNRVSIGIQSLRDAGLKALGRLHSAKEARAAFEIARDTFPRVTFDLIYPRQHQSLNDWKAELTEALSLAADHLSLYQLTIEPGTAFGDRFAANKLPGLPSDDVSADMFFLTQDMTQDAGLPAYEISNHAKPGAESLHNLIYWRSGDWVGVGPGAHGRLTLNSKRIETISHAAPSLWLSSVEQTGSGYESRQPITDEDAKTEAIMMGLRLSEGIAVDFLTKERTKPLITDGLLERSSERIMATDKGRPLLNAILRELLA